MLSSDDVLITFIYLPMGRKGVNH
uniref:Uncharacterized protein n=1 Tax=Anguilla anguilla TaxID=7936 RepID=A0A0E9S8X9_ANGAN